MQAALKPPPPGLVRAARDGDDEARQALAADLRPGLLAVVNAQMGPGARRWTDPEDIAQRVLADVLDQLAALPDAQIEQHLVGRLARTARWRIADDVRRHRREAGESVLGEVGLAAAPQPSSDSSSGPVTRADTRRWLEALIERLPADYADVVRLRGLEGLDVATTAARLGITPESVRQRWSRARKRLAERMAARRQAEDDEAGAP